jgi:phospholipase/lecithinase/hemolysin
MKTLNIYKVLIVATFISMTLFSHQSLAQNQSIDRVVVFGSSLSDTGNAFIWLSNPANQQCGISLNVPPYDSLDEFTVPDGPYAKGGHHFTNGATWVEGLARYLALAGNTRPAFQNDGQKASNYAVGGARAVDHFCRFNLPDQVSAYLADFPQTSANTQITIEIGGNDVRDALVAASMGQDPAPIIQNALLSVSNAISTLYSHGVRKFLIMNVPDIGKTPAVRLLDNAQPGISSFANLLTVAFNTGLGQVISAMNSLPGNRVKVLDVYTKVNDVIATPGAYGFTNVTNACVTPNVPPFVCKQPDTYLFWDGIHPTKTFHDIVAQQAIAVISAP